MSGNHALTRSRQQALLIAGGRGDPGVALHSPSSNDRGAGDGSCSTGGPRLLKLWFKVRAES